MNSEIGVVSFTYMGIEAIASLEDIMSSDPDVITQIFDRYVLLSNDDNELHHDCPIIELCKSDINFTSMPEERMIYNDLVRKFGKDIVDLFIVEDISKIQNKVLYIINFAMDSIYKTDTIKIEFKRADHKPRKSSIPSLIYYVLWENFDIKDQCTIGQQNYIVIKRRK